LRESGERRTLDRYLSRCGAETREGAVRAIREGRVSVDGERVLDPDRWIRVGHSTVELDGEPVLPRAGTSLLVMNKPRGVVTTLADPEGRPTVLDLLPSEHRRDRSLRPVGRLDRASAGLLLWTDDTDLADRLLDPRTHVEKEYRLKVRPALGESDLAAWRGGLDIGDPTPADPVAVAVERVSSRSCVLVARLREGRNRQLRRMAEASGSRVEWLVRVRFGPILLGDLPPGASRPATPAERDALGLLARD
jgi:23S rRNA pseudouridine2605 synthase